MRDSTNSVANNIKQIANAIKNQMFIFLYVLTTVFIDLDTVTAAKAPIAKKPMMPDDTITAI